MDSSSSPAQWAQRLHSPGGWRRAGPLPRPRPRDWATAAAEQDRLLRLFDIAFEPQGRSGDAGGIGAFKAACALLGVIDSGMMPAPIEALGADEIAGVAAILDEVGLR